MSLRIAVMGASSTIGKELLEVIHESGFPATEVLALGTRDAMGREVSFGDRRLKMKNADEFDFATLDLCFLAVGERAARKWAPKITGAGTITIDVSPAFRMDPDVPLVSPEANPEAASGWQARKLLTVPGGPAAQLVAVLKPLMDAAGLKRITATACIAVSEQGRPAMDELWNQTKGIFVNQAPETSEYAKQIAFNLIPQVGEFLDDGTTDEEQRLIDETRKILGINLPISATCIQVPVFVGHSLAVHMELERPMSVPDVRDMLRESPGIVVIDNRAEESFITPIECVGEWATYVSRIRADPALPNGLALWIVSDNLRKASAVNAVQLAEHLLRDGAFAKPLNPV